MHPSQRDVWSLVNAAVPKVKGIMDACTYPKRFPSIHEAKCYIAQTCHANNYNYNLHLTTSHFVEGQVKDKVQFLVAVFAYQDGEFYLDTPLPPKGNLKRLIQTDSERIEAMHIAWPSWFPLLRDAKEFVQHICASAGFTYSDFPSMPAERYQSQVNLSVARRAYVAGRFATRQPVYGANGELLVPRPVLQLSTSITELVLTVGRQVGDVDSGATNMMEPQQPVEVSPVGVAVDLQVPAAHMVEVEAILAQDEAEHDGTKAAYIGAAASSENDTPSKIDTPPDTPTTISDSDNNLLIEDENEAVSVKEDNLERMAVAECSEPVEQTDPFKNLITDLRRAFILKDAFE